MFDKHIKEGASVVVTARGPFQSEGERKLIGCTGRVVRSYVSSARVEIDGHHQMFSKSTLDLVK